MNALHGLCLNLLLALCFSGFIPLISSAQELEGDKIPTSNGDLIVHPIIHGSLALSWNDLIIFIDPYGGPERFGALPKPDLVFITDIHGDHLNLETLNELDLSATIMVVPQAVADQLPDKYARQIEVLGNGDSRSFENILVEALPMYNLPESAESRHPKGRGNGYVLNLDDFRVYISGDTEDIPEMRALEGINLAFVCMNLPYTMSVEQAASAVIEFQPEIVYPFHYRGQGGLSDVDLFAKLVKEKAPGVEVRLRNWYP